MGTLAGCLKKLGFTQSEAQYVTELADQYRTEGFGEKANEKAVLDHIKDIEDSRRMVYEQLSSQVDKQTLGEIFGEVKDASGEPTPEPQAVPEPAPKFEPKVGEPTPEFQYDRSDKTLVDIERRLGSRSGRATFGKLKEELKSLGFSEDQISKMDKSQMAYYVSGGRMGSPNPDIVFRRISTLKAIAKIVKEERAAEPDTKWGLVRNILHSPIFLSFTQAEKTVKSPEGKELTGMFAEAIGYRARIGGVLAEKARELGYFKIKTKEEAEAITKQIESGQGHPLSAVFDDAVKIIQAFRPEFQPRKNYVRRMLKPEIAEVLWDDIAAFEKMIAEKQLAPNDASLAKALKGRSEAFQKAVLHIQDLGGKKMTLVQALEKFKSTMVKDRDYDPGFLKERKFTLPSEFYETDFRIILRRYMEQLSHWVASEKTFGRDYKTYNEKITRLQYLHPEEAGRIAKLADMWTGEWERKYGLSKPVKNVVSAWTGAQLGLKIGLGFATLANLFQPVISFVPEAGGWRTLRGGILLADEKTRAFIRKSGLGFMPDDAAMRAIAGDVPGGFWGRFGQKMARLSGFEGVNRGLLFWAGATGKVFAEDLWKIAQKDGLKGQWARKTLKEWGIQYDELLSNQEDDMLRAIYRFATDSQLQKNFLKEPFIMNQPAYRPIFLFKRFGYRQMVYIKDMMTREVKQGNVMPAIRLAAGGFLGGAAVVWAQNQIKTLISGEDTYRKDDSWGEEVLNNLAVVGAVGMLSDLGKIDRVSQLPEQIKRGIAPVVWSDVETIIGSSTKFLEDLSKYDDFVLASRRNAPNLFSMFGALPRLAAKRTFADSQKANRLKYQKQQERQEIFGLLLEGNSEAAVDRVLLWNEHHKDEPIKYGDVSTGAFANWMERKAKTHAEAKTTDVAEQREIMKEHRADIAKRLKQIKDSGYTQRVNQGVQ
jgi:hypothetical protein